MRFGDYMDMAVNSLFHRKLRSWLTVLGIVIGIAAVVGLVSIGEGFSQSIRGQLSAFGGNSIFISPGRQQAGGFGFGFGGMNTQAVEGELTTNDIAVLKGIRGIESVDGVITQRTDVTFRGQKATTNVQGATTELWHIFDIVALEQGRLFSSSERRVAVVGSSFANSVFEQDMKIGDIVLIGNASFRIVGILQQGSGIAASIVDNAVIIPRDDARQMFLGSGSKEVSAIIIKASENADMDAVVKDVEARMRASHKKARGGEDFTVTSSQAIQGRVDQISSTVTVFLGGIAAISLLVGAIGIANTMFMSVMERTRQIGILKALGAKNRDVMSIFMFESSLLGFVGGAVGAALGAVVGLALAGVSSGRSSQSPFGASGFAPAISAELIAFAIIFSIIIGALSGILPARRAAKLDPVEALMYE